MGHPKAIAVLALALAALVASGCASARWAVARHFRPPGEKLQNFPETVWTEYDCDAQHRPFFVVEKNELLPRRVRAGGDFNHRIVYAMCSTDRTQGVQGRLHTLIRFKGRPIVRQREDGYELKPGRWIVDTVVNLPEAAEPGIYAYEVAFDSESVRFEKSLTFIVRGR